MENRILVGMPSGSRFVHHKVMEDIFTAVKDHDVTFRIAYGYQVDVNRNKLCSQVLAGTYSHIFFVDSDVRVPPDALDYLLSCDEDIVLGYYSHRGQRTWDGTTSSLVKPDQIGYSELFTTDELSKMYGRDRRKIEVGAGGMGCGLISRNALETIGEPWFHYRDRRKGDLSEDYWFCSQAKLAGFRIFADLRVACLHGVQHWEDVGGFYDRYQNDPR